MTQEVSSNALAVQLSIDGQITQDPTVLGHVVLIGLFEEFSELMNLHACSIISSASMGLSRAPRYLS